MNLLKKSIILFIILLLPIISLVACDNAEELEIQPEQIVGNWRFADENYKTMFDNYEDYTYFDIIISFREDGTGTANQFGLAEKSFVYKIQGNALSVQYDDEPDKWYTETCKFSGDILITKDENGEQISNRVSQEYVNSIQYLKDDLQNARVIVENVFQKYVSIRSNDSDINATIQDLTILNNEDEKRLNCNLGRNELMVKIVFDISNIGENDINELREENLINGIYDEENDCYKDNIVLWHIGPLIYEYGVQDLTESYLDLYLNNSNQ